MTNSNIEETLNKCEDIKIIADEILESIIEIVEKDIDSIDSSVAQSQLNTILSNYNEATEILNSLITTTNEEEDDKEQNDIYKSQINDIIDKKNKAIEIKKLILSKDVDLDKPNTTDTLLTLSQCLVYRWQEDFNSSPNSSPTTSTSTTTATNNKVIEKEIIGNGTFYLKQVLGKQLNFIQVQYNNENNECITGETQKFIITKETPILVYKKGHYVITSDNNYYGIMFPEQIPMVYIDVLESKLKSISLLVTLPSATEDETTITTTTSTTTTSLTKTTDNEIVTIQEKKQVNFVVNSIKTASSGVDSGSQTIVEGILSASNMISLGLRGGGYYLKSSLQKNETPSTVSPIVMRSVDVIKCVTPYAKNGSSYVINSLSSVVAGVGGGIFSLVKTISTSGTNNENFDNTENEEESLALNAAADFGKTTLKSVGSIINAFGDGISQIYEEATSTTVDVVNHKYGEQAAIVTGKTLSASKDIFDTAMSVRGIAFNAIKNGGVKIVNDNFNNNNQQRPATLLEYYHEEGVEKEQLLITNGGSEENNNNNNNNNNNDDEETIQDYKMEKSILFQ